MPIKTDLIATQDTDALSVVGGVLTVANRGIITVSAETGTTDDINTITVSPAADLSGQLADYTAWYILTAAVGHVITLQTGGNIAISNPQVITEDDAVVIIHDRTTAKMVRAVMEVANEGKAETFNARLSLSASSAVTLTDTISSDVYLHPYKGNKISLWDGSMWVERTLTAPISTSRSGVSSSQNVDIFVIYSGGAPILAKYGWTGGDTARSAHAIAYRDGVAVLSSNHQYRYVGTLRVNAANTGFEDSEGSRFVWNYYHRIKKALRKTRSLIPATIITTLTANVWSQGSSGEAKPEFVVGLFEGQSSYFASTYYTISGSTVGWDTAIGLNDQVMNVNTAIGFYSAPSVNVPTMMSSEVKLAEGYHYVCNWYISASSGSIHIYTRNTGSVLGGMSGGFEC